MRLDSFLFATAFVALTACSGGGTDTVDPCDDDPTLPECQDDEDPCDGESTLHPSAACCADDPSYGACACQDDTGGAYCDCIEAEGYADTAACVAIQPLVMTGFFSAPGTNYLNGTYAGGEEYGLWYWPTWGDPAFTLDEATLYDGYANLCQFTWTATSIADPGMAACADCDWTARVALSAGTDTTASNPVTTVAAGLDWDAAGLNAAYNCASFGIDATLSDGFDFGYGYGQYNYSGTDYPALYFYSEPTDGTAPSWGPATVDDVLYNDVTGDFQYKWITQLGYLSWPPAAE